MRANAVAAVLLLGAACTNVQPRVVPDYSADERRGCRRAIESWEQLEREIAEDTGPRFNYSAYRLEDRRAEADGWVGGCLHRFREKKRTEREAAEQRAELERSRAAQEAERAVMEARFRESSELPETKLIAASGIVCRFATAARHVETSMAREKEKGSISGYVNVNALYRYGEQAQQLKENISNLLSRPGFPAKLMSCGNEAVVMATSCVEVDWNEELRRVTLDVRGAGCADGGTIFAVKDWLQLAPIERRGANYPLGAEK